MNLRSNLLLLKLNKWLNMPKLNKLSFPHYTFVTTVDWRGTLPENAHLKDRKSLATIAEAKGTLPETVTSEH